MVQGADKTMRFVAGIVMMMGGAYLFLQSVHVSMGFDYPLYRFGRNTLTTGYVFIPFMIGIVLIFFNSKSSVGWLVTLGSLAILILGIITSTRLHMQHMNAFQLMMILVLLMGGLGLWLSSMRN
jgi:hypothetical protein